MAPGSTPYKGFLTIHISSCILYNLPKRCFVQQAENVINASVELMGLLHNWRQLITITTFKYVLTNETNLHGKQPSITHW